VAVRSAGDRRVRGRLDAGAPCAGSVLRAFHDAFFPPSGDDPSGLLRFFGITAIVAIALVGAGV